MSLGTGRHELIRELLESTWYGMRQMLEIQEARGNLKVGEVLIVGEGARSRFWTQIKADITGKRYRRAGEVQSASRGAATPAAVGLGAHEDAWAASEAMGSPESEPVEPTADPVLRDVYDRRYLAFKSLYPALRQLFGELRDRTSESRDEQDARKLSASETWGVGAGRLGKQT